MLYVLIFLCLFLSQVPIVFSNASCFTEFGRVFVQLTKEPAVMLLMSFLYLFIMPLSELPLYSPDEEAAAAAESPWCVPTDARIRDTTPGGHRPVFHNSLSNRSPRLRLLQLARNVIGISSIQPLPSARITPRTVPLLYAAQEYE